jgi:hypothetical protein
MGGFLIGPVGLARQDRAMQLPPACEIAHLHYCARHRLLGDGRGNYDDRPISRYCARFGGSLKMTGRTMQEFPLSGGYLLSAADFGASNSV